MFVSSTIIEDICVMQKAGLASALAFFYCDFFGEDRKKELRGLLSSLSSPTLSTNPTPTSLMLNRTSTPEHVQKVHALPVTMHWRDV